MQSTMNLATVNKEKCEINIYFFQSDHKVMWRQTLGKKTRETGIQGLQKWCNFRSNSSLCQYKESVTHNKQVFVQDYLSSTWTEIWQKPLKIRDSALKNRPRITFYSTKSVIFPVFTSNSFVPKNLSNRSGSKRK